MKVSRVARLAAGGEGADRGNADGAGGESEVRASTSDSAGEPGGLFEWLRLLGFGPPQNGGGCQNRFGIPFW